MRTEIWILAGALLAALTLNAADKEAQKERRERQAVRAEKQETRETKGDIDKHVAAINRLDNNKASLMAGMAAVSKETAVPLPKIEAEHKEHPNIGLAGLFVAHELAVRTHKGVEHFLDARKKGRSWAEIAKANGVSADELEIKLSRIEQAMRNAK